MGLKESGLRGSLRNVSVGIAAIPDNVVDNFEDHPDGIYDTGDDLSDFYSGPALNNADRTTEDDPAEGEKHLKITDSRNSIYSLENNGLNRYHEPGDTVAVLLKEDGDSQPHVGTNLSDENGNIEGYSFGFQPSGNEFRLRKYSDFAESDDAGDGLASGSISLSNDEWYWLEFDTPEIGDGSMELRVYDVTLNDEPERGSELESLSAVDDDFANGGGVGYKPLSASTNDMFADWMRVID